MSDRYVGGLIKGDGTELTTSRFGTNSGMFTLGQQLQAFTSSNWPSDYDVVLEFTSTGSFKVPGGVTEIAEYLIIAGGGGGADTGGGGAGGFKTGTGIPVISGKTYEIGVGSGGAAGGNNSTVAGGNGNPSGFITEANVRYYVSVGNPGAGNKYYVKTEQNDDAASNLTPELKLYEGSTYVFDQSHPTNAPNHPLRFASDGAPSFTPYTTGVTTNQPSVGVGTPASAVQLQVASPAPELFYYCTVHGAMGNEINTLANVSVMSVGGGGGGAHNDKAKEGGSGGGGGGVPTVMPGGRGTPGDPTSVAPALQGHNGGASSPTGSYNGGGGGGAAQAGFDGRLANFPVGHGGNGGNGLSHSISGSTRFFSGGGGGAAEGQGGIGGGGNAHYSTAGGRPATPIGEGGNANSGGGGGGTWEAAQEGGGSGIVFIKYKNKNNNRSFEFTGSGVWKNDFGAKEVEYLVVAGAGGAGCDNPFGVGGGAGGGAGGFRTGTLSVTNDTNYTIAIGAGGAGSPTHPTNGTRGSNSIFSSIKSLGGGGGGSRSTQPALNPIRDGGSGGGSGQRDSATAMAGKAVTGDILGALQGNNGGEGYWAPGEGGASGGGGGGGAGSNGQASFKVSSTYYGGNGGDAIASDITGSTVFYAGGGGGQSHPAVTAGRGSLGGNTTTPTLKGGGGDGKPTSTAGDDGISNTGGGGGAGGPVGGTGGSGIVVIKITG